jgi:hypothetical protein
MDNGERQMMLVDSRGWAKAKVAARYAGVSERTFRQWLKDGLKHSRLRSGTILVKYEWIDEYLENCAVTDTLDEINRIFESVR